jgi:hypothetical protein
MTGLALRQMRTFTAIPEWAADHPPLGDKAGAISQNPISGPQEAPATGVRYQRNVKFSTNQLLDVNGVTDVAYSIDPFFFHIYWYEKEEEEEFEEGERERFVLKGLKYESLEIEELKFDLDDYSHHADFDEKKLLGMSRKFRRLADRIEDLLERLARRRHHH